MSKWFLSKKRPLHRSFRKPQNNTILFYSSKNISTSLRSPRCDVSFVCILPRSLGQLECLHLKTGCKESHFHSLPFWQAEATVPFTSPKVLSASPTNFCLSRIDSQIVCNLNPSKNLTCLSSKLRTEFTSRITKSTSPGLPDPTFFARWRSVVSFLVWVLLCVFLWIPIRLTCDQVYFVGKQTVSLPFNR